MTQKEIIKGRLGTSRWWLSEVLPRLSETLLAWAPAEGVRTVRGQLVEIISVEAQLVPALTGEPLTDPALAEIDEETSSLEALVAALGVVRERTLACLDGLSEEELAAEVTVPQWYGAFWRTPMPCGEHFRNIAEHEFYHAGQLMTYLWVRGDNPYDW